MPTPVAVTKAVASLRNAENGALARSAMSSADGQGDDQSLYTGSGRDFTPTKAKAKGKKKGISAIVVIALTLIGGGIFLGSSNSLLGPAMEALFTEATDTQYASASMRSTRLMRYFLSDTGATSTTWTGAKKYTAMSSSFKKRLAQQGIEIEGSGSNKTLVYTKTDADGVEITQRISAGDFDDVYMNDVDFRDSYSTAKRGRVATFFDNIANRIYQKLGLSRNLFSNFKQTGDADVDLDNYNKTLSPRFETGDINVSAGGNEEKRRPLTKPDGSPDLDANGNQKYESYTERNTDSASVKNTSASNFLDTASKVSSVMNIGCAIMKVGNLISMTVAANELYQSINYFMGLMENISKMKAGYGDESAYHEVMNFLSTTTTSDVADVTNTSGGTSEISGAPLQANGMQMVLAKAPANPQTTSRYSLERVSGAVLNALRFTSYTTTGCAVAAIAEGAISLAVTIGTGGIAKIAGGLFTKIIGAVAINATITGLLSFLIPTIAQTLFTNVFEDTTGIPAGELFTRGASAANTRIGRNGSGQSLSSEQAALAYNQVNNTVIALDAEVDRKNHSPFDITNKNTFLGSIAYSLLPAFTSSSTTSFATLARVASTSTASLIGNVYADGKDSTYMTTFGKCSDLESIGAKGDIYCVPVTTTDITTLNLSPEDPTYQSVISDAQNCDNEGNCTIDDGSNLAKYITFCDGRDSPFGVMDNGILSSFDTTTGNSAIDAALNGIPFVGDVIGILDGISQLDPDHQAWATGQRCVNTTDSTNNEFWQSEGKYYQRYVEDMRLLEDMGAFEETGSKNPVTAYEDKYAAEHPLDTSHAGIVAHYTGLSKADAETILALVDYANFIANYDAETRIALEKTNNPSGLQVAAAISAEMPPTIKSTSGKTHPLIATHHYIIYADIRNRSYAA